MENYINREESLTNLKNLLKNWCNKNNAIEETTTSFWYNFNEFKREEPDEFYSVFGNGEVKLFFDKISYELNLPALEQEFVSVSLDIFVNNKQVGWFKQIFYLDGSKYDDNFVLD